MAIDKEDRMVYSLDRMKAEYKASKKLKELTPEQEKEVQDAYNKMEALRIELEKAKDDAKEAVKKLADLQVENERLKKIKEEAKKRERTDRKNKIKDQIAKSQERYNAAKEALKKLGGRTGFAFDPKWRPKN